jgi:ferredoxin
VKVQVDATRCQGHSRCLAVAPELFEVDDYGLSSARGDGIVPEGMEQQGRLAAANCPEHAITVTEE